MAEIVGLALAAPGVIDVIMRGAAAVYDKIDTFRHMDSTMASFRDLSLNIKEGTLFFALTNVKAASSDRMIPAKILAQLDAALECVKQALGHTEKGLSCVGNGHLGRLKYALWQGEGSKSRLDKHFNELKDSCDRLRDLCLQLHQYRSAESCFLLTSDSFKIRHETPNNRPGSVLPNSDIWVARGNYACRDKRVECDFVLEDKTQENDVQFLSSKLNAHSLGELNGSILPVLGYRQPPYNQPDGTKIFQVVVKVPPNLNRGSLSHRLKTEPCPDLRGRLELCRSIAHATKVVHGIGLVHKALRPRAILMLWEAGAPPLTAKAYLQDWTYARGVSGATAELGEVVWPKRIYQHPERQGEYAEAKYETRHDIYCLGVCILEILLWRPFVVNAPTGAQGSQLKICDLFPRYGFRREEQNGGLPQRYRGDLAKITSRPWITKTIWEDIADAELRNPDLTKLVRQCLDGVFKAAEEVEVRLGELIATAPP